MQNAVKDDEEELPDSSTTAAALAPKSNVEHIKQVQEKMDTGVLDGVADESDRILGKKNKGKKKMFKKNGGNGSGAIPNPWKKDGSGSGSGSSSDTAMELEEAQARIADLEEKLGACKANGEDGEGGGELEELGFIPDEDFDLCFTDEYAGPGNGEFEGCRKRNCRGQKDCFNCKFNVYFCFRL